MSRVPTEVAILGVSGPSCGIPLPSHHGLVSACAAARPCNTAGARVAALKTLSRSLLEVNEPLKPSYEFAIRYPETSVDSSVKHSPTRRSSSSNRDSFGAKNPVPSHPLIHPQRTFFYVMQHLDHPRTRVVMSARLRGRANSLSFFKRHLQLPGTILVCAAATIR